MKIYNLGNLTFDMALEECNGFGSDEKLSSSEQLGWNIYESKGMGNCMAEEAAASVAASTCWRCPILEYLTTTLCIVLVIIFILPTTV